MPLPAVQHSGPLREESSGRVRTCSRFFKLLYKYVFTYKPPCRRSWVAWNQSAFLLCSFHRVINFCVLLSQGLNARRRGADPAIEVNQVLRAQCAGGLLEGEGIDHIVVTGIGVTLKCFVVIALGVQHLYNVACAGLVSGAGGIQSAAPRNNSLFQSRRGFDVGVYLTKQAACVDAHIPLYGEQCLICSGQQ